MDLKPIERYKLIESIALKLQAEYNTRGINILLSAYGVETYEVDIVSSKREYVCELLKNQTNEVIVKIASDLDLAAFKTLITETTFKNILNKNELNSVIDDFNRAIKNVSTDPDVAITSASSTLESICKAICDFFNEPYPSAESMQPLIYKAYKLLNLSCDQHANEQIKKNIRWLE